MKTLIYAYLQQDNKLLKGRFSIDLLKVECEINMQICFLVSVKCCASIFISLICSITKFSYNFNILFIVLKLLTNFEHC